MFFPFPIVRPRPLVCLVLSPPLTLRPHIIEPIKLLKHVVREKEERERWIVAFFVGLEASVLFLRMYIFFFLAPHITMYQFSHKIITRDINKCPFCRIRPAGRPLANRKKTCDFGLITARCFRSIQLLCGSGSILLIYMFLCFNAAYCNVHI